MFVLNLMFNHIRAVFRHAQESGRMQNEWVVEGFDTVSALGFRSHTQNSRKMLVATYDIRSARVRYLY